MSDPTTVAEEFARATAAEKALSDRIAKLEPALPPPPAPSPPPASTFVVNSSIVASSTPLVGTVSWTGTVSGGTADHVDFLIDGVLHWPEKAAPWGGDLDTRLLANGLHTFTIKAYDAVGGSAMTTVQRDVANPVVVQPPPPVATTRARACSGYGHTKDNIQVRRNGNGNVAIQLAKIGTGPVTGFAIQDRFGPVYSKGDGGLYEAAALLGGPNGTVIASTIWRPGTNGGVADAAFPIVMFDAPSAPVADRTPFWIRLLNKHASPDANYVSINVLYCFGGFPTPRQPSFPDAELAVLVNTGADWVDHHRTPMIDVLPGHEGQGYSGALLQAWKPIGGSNQVRQTFTIDAPLTFSKISVGGLRRDSGTRRVLTFTLEDSAGNVIVTGNVPYASIPISTPGQDTGGQTIATISVPATNIGAGTYRLRLSSAGGYSATPLRKALAGTYPTLKADWGSYMCQGFAENSSNGGATWSKNYGSPAQTDWQFAVSA